MTTQTKEEFLKNVHHHASALKTYQNNLHEVEYLIDSQPVYLDAELNALWLEAYHHEVKMLEAALELSKACLRKLESRHVTDTYTKAS